jgi:23S rRNA (uracil1939-C5)-methyltransferase
MAPTGQAVGRGPDGKVVFVDGALPGERVQVEPTGDHRSYSRAAVVEVIHPAADRVTPPCPAARRGCGGCQWQHATPAAQRRYKAAAVDDTLRRLGGIAAPPAPTTVELAPWAYRTSLRVGVVGGRAALRRSRSHQLIEVEGCLIVHPLIAELLAGPRYPGARQVVLRCGSRTGERVAVTDPPAARRRARLPPGVGARFFHEEAAGRGWRVSGPSFFQSRPDGVDALAALVKEAASSAAAGTALDLYSGVGVFAGVLAGAGCEVTAVEGSASAVEDARANLRGLPATVLRADVTRFQPPAADLVVADPSRAGLGRSGVRAVAAAGAARVVLISCDAASLGRDAALLAERGYRLSSVTLVDMFPQTFHVEVVTVYDR